MKKNISLIVALILGGYCQLFAQKNYVEDVFDSPVYFPVAISASSDDTLGLSEFFNNGNNHPTVYAVDGGSGYIVGNNNYGDKQKAQQYSSQGIYVKKIIFWFGRKQNNSGNSNSKISAKIYDLDGTGVSTAGQVPAPGTVLSSVDINIADVDTSGDFTIVNLQPPVFVTGNFAVGFDVTTLANNDYVGCVSTKNGETAVDNLSWEQQDNNSWHTILQAWTDLDIDMAIFPVVSTTAGIEDETFMNGIKMSQNHPNPFGNETIIRYEIQNNANVDFEVVDLMGRKVIIINEGVKNKGIHTLTLTTEKLASGAYYYSLKANDEMLTRKMVVTK